MVSHLRPRAVQILGGLPVAVGVIGALLILGGTAGPGRAAGFTVKAQNYEFLAPGGGSTLAIHIGDQVTWVASGDPHTVTSGSAGAEDNRFPDHPASVGFLADGQSFTATFATAGTYPYFCEVHPEQMSGLITVVAAITAPPTAAPTPRPTRPPTAAPTRPPATATAAPTPVPPTPSRPTPSTTVTASTGPSPTTSPSRSAEASPTASGPGSGPVNRSGTGTTVLVPIVLAAVAVAGGAALLRMRRRS